MTVAAHWQSLCDTVNIAKAFTDHNHENLTTVLFVLTMDLGMKLYVAAPFLDPEEKYVKYGKLDDSFHPHDVQQVTDAIWINAVGSIEKVLVAALQILYANGSKNGKGTDYYVNFLGSRGKHTCDVTVRFLYNGQSAKVNLRQSTKDDREITLYIDD